MHLKFSLVQNVVLVFFKIESHFEEVQNFEFKIVGGIPKGHPLAPIGAVPVYQVVPYSNEHDQVQMVKNSGA